MEIKLDKRQSLVLTVLVVLIILYSSTLLLTNVNKANRIKNLEKHVDELHAENIRISNLAKDWQEILENCLKGDKNVD